ncbi:MAG: hypothetical protein IKZ52_01645 [Bacteroidales bacterium]|nr:hypothetical protein [Bacteroidales bacterium]
MKKIIIAIAVALLAIAHTGCATKQVHSQVSTEPNYEFDEARMNAIFNLCDSTQNMLYDETTPATTLNAQMNRVIDTLKYALRHCENLKFNIWMRGYARHILEPVILDGRLKDDVKNKVMSLPFEWTVMEDDTSVYAITIMYMRPEEMFDRYATIDLYSDNQFQKCTFVIEDYIDPIFNDVRIDFLDENNGKTTLHAADAEKTDYDSSGVSRLIFPLEQIMPLLEKSEGVNISYKTKNEEILFMHAFPLVEKRHIKRLFDGKRK